MRDGLRVYAHLLLASLRGQTQYRSSFLAFAVGGFLLTAIEFFALWALFDRFGALRQWSMAEVGMCYGMSSSAFALAGMLARGFDGFSNLVRNGGFDRILLRPRTTVLQILGQEIFLIRLGRLAQALLILAASACLLPTTWSCASILLVAASVFAGTCVFIGLFMLQATMCFWTIEALEITNCLTDGGNFAARMPMTIYRPAFRWFFTLVVPLACVNYLPLSALLPRHRMGVPAALPWLGPLIGMAFLGLGLVAWGFGIRHYRSTGS